MIRVLLLLVFLVPAFFFRALFALVFFFGMDAFLFSLTLVSDKRVGRVHTIDSFVLHILSSAEP